MKQAEVLYFKYKEKVKDIINSLEFYDLFMNSIKSGSNNFSSYQKYLDNKIDMKWVEKIEDTLISIDNIVRNPRRFIEQEEEVVPIEQAKGITEESIKHLAQHTNMIAKIDKKGNVTPNKILNIYKEETYATYENRFLYTLLINLNYFIDKRLFIIDSQMVKSEFKLNYDSTFKFGNENLKYSVSIESEEEVKRKELDVVLDEDTSDMTAIERIERIRKILYSFQRSQLITSIKGCTIVRPPLSKTNVLTKDPDFKKAVELWNFIESYKGTGLKVEVVEHEGMISDDYIDDLYVTSLLNYAIFTHHNKPNKEDVIENSVVNEIEPKFVERYLQKIVDDFDLDIDVVEKVFIDHIKQKSKARKENEAKIKKIIDDALRQEKLLQLQESEEEKKNKNNNNKNNLDNNLINKKEDQNEEQHVENEKPADSNVDNQKSIDQHIEEQKVDNSIINSTNVMANIVINQKLNEAVKEEKRVEEQPKENSVNDESVNVNEKINDETPLKEEKPIIEEPNIVNEEATPINETKPDDNLVEEEKTEVEEINNDEPENTEVAPVIEEEIIKIDDNLLDNNEEKIVEDNKLEEKEDSNIENIDINKKESEEIKPLEEQNKIEEVETKTPDKKEKRRKRRTVTIPIHKDNHKVFYKG